MWIEINQPSLKTFLSSRHHNIALKEGVTPSNPRALDFSRTPTDNMFSSIIIAAHVECTFVVANV